MAMTFQEPRFGYVRITGETLVELSDEMYNLMVRDFRFVDVWYDLLADELRCTVWCSSFDQVRHGAVPFYTIAIDAKTQSRTITGIVDNSMGGRQLSTAISGQRIRSLFKEPRYGRFAMHLANLQGAIDPWINTFIRDIRVTRAEIKYIRNVVEYEGWSSHFRALTIGDDIPRYEITVALTADGYERTIVEV